MSCPVTPPPPRDDPATSGPTASEAAIPEAVTRFRRVGSSVFLAFFATGLFDQAMVPEISVALRATGRIRDDPFGRAARSAASDQLVFASNDDRARARETERLLRLHRDVRGTGPDGTRYSALQPDLWNWILYSTFFMHLGAYQVLYGRKQAAADAETVYDYFREHSSELQLPGRSGLIKGYAEAREYYEDFAATRLEVTPTLLDAVNGTRRPRRPEFVPAWLTPAWAVLSPLAGEAACVMGFGVMSPTVRATVPFSWNRWRRAEFAAGSVVLRTLFHALPSRVTLAPIARPGADTQRLVRKYEEMGLSSFRPDGASMSRSRPRSALPRPLTA